MCTSSKTSHLCTIYKGLGNSVIAKKTYRVGTLPNLNDNHDCMNKEKIETFLSKQCKTSSVDWHKFYLPSNQSEYGGNTSDQGWFY